MVMNLDKCIGCHTCSITCKNVWTNREGAEYMYFNNVETKPGIGYPKNWEDQEKWKGGWKLGKDGKLSLRTGSKPERLLKLFYHPDQPEMDARVQALAQKAPAYQFTTPDGIGHSFWVMDDDKDIASVTKIFERLPVLYIADGHHRSASAAAVARKRKAANPHHTGQESYNFFLAVIFPSNQLYIMDYNRLVKDLNGLDKAQFLEKVHEKFEVEKTGQARPGARHQFGMYLDGEWYTLRAKDGSFDAQDPVAALDVSILQNNLLAPVLGIGDPRTDKRINFVGGIRGLGELEKRINSGEYQVAFSMFPTSIEELMKVADAHLIMPPKSTWFEPKLRSGLVTYKY